MTIPGVGSIVASAVLASIGDISRFATPEKLSCYFGLTPKIRQSSDRGRISTQGNVHVRKMLVEAAWSAKLAPGPLRAFFACVSRTRARGGCRDSEKAGDDDGRDRVHLYARPAVTAMKLRKVALKAGAPREHGKVGPGRDCWIKEIRHREHDYAARAEQAYEKMVAAWKRNRQSQEPRRAPP
jgi:transposase